MPNPIIRHYFYVHESLVPDYFAMGWSYADGNPVMYNDPLFGMVLILQWRCLCKPRYLPQHRKEVES